MEKPPRKSQPSIRVVATPFSTSLQIPQPIIPVHSSLKPEPFSGNIPPSFIILSRPNAAKLRSRIPLHRRRRNPDPAHASRRPHHPHAEPEPHQAHALRVRHRSL